MTDARNKEIATASTEDALAVAKASEEHFRTMVATLPTLAWCATADGNAQFFSQRWLDYTGLSFEEAEGDGWTQAIHPSDLTMIYQRWVEILASGKQGEVEARLRRHDGAYRWHLFRAAPLLDDQGKVARWYGTNSDIDDLKRAEQELRRSKVYLEYAQKRSHTGSVGLRVATGEIFWSDETARIYGYDPAVPPTMEMVLGRVHPDDLPFMQDVFAQASKGGTNFDFMHRLLMPDGSIKHLRNFAHAVRDEAGEGEILGVVMDITDQIMSKAALEDALAATRESEVHFRTMLATIPTLAWRTSAGGNAEFYSQRWYDYTGLSFEAARDDGWTQAVHPDDLKLVYDKWMELLASGKPGEVEVRFRRSDGAYRWHLFRATPLFDDRAKLTGWYGTNTDIDDLKRAETFLAGEKQLFAMSATGHPLHAILDAFCRIVEELAEGAIASILLLDDDGKRLRLGAAPSLPESYRQAIDGEWIGPAAGSCGTAAFREEHVFVADIASHPLWADCKARALEHGLRACFATPIMSTAGKVLGAFGIYSKQPRDITPREMRITEQFTPLASILIERKRAEDALARSEAFLAEGQRISKTGSWAWNVVSGKLVWSLEHRRIFGFDLDHPNITLDTFLQSVHPADAVRVQAVLDDAVRRSCEFSLEYRIVLPDGSLKHIISQGRPVASELAQVEEFVGTAMDINHRYDAKVALESALAEAMASEDQLRTLIDTMPGLAHAAGPNGEAEFVSQGWLNYAGMTKEEVQGYGWANAIHPDDVGVMVETWQRIMATKRAGEQEARLRRFDGEYRWFTFRAAPLLDQRGNVVKWYGVNVDIEDQKRAEFELRCKEADLRKAQAELAHVTRVTTMGELAASIAHEINQPIAGVVINGNACLRWLAREQTDSESIAEAREAVQRIIRDGARAGDVITRIRALFKKTETPKEWLIINDVIREVIVLARGEMEKRRVAVQLELDPDLPRVPGDRVQLQQVMLNLILNGIDAMSVVEDRRRELVIGTHLIESAEVLVTVRDSGTGVDEASIEQLFAPFHTTKPGGLGMGLAISRTIVDSHKGRLWATTNDGPGATFQFTLSTGSD